MNKYIYSLLLMLTLSGCAGVHTTDNKYANENHLLNNITTNDDGSLQEGSFQEYHDLMHAIKEAPTEESWRSKLYLTKGMALSKTACYDYLDAISSDQNNSLFTQKGFGVAVVLATGIMGLNGLTEDNFTELALGAAAINSSIDLYREHYLLGPDGDVIIDMVKNAMVTVEDKINTKSPSSFIEAYTLLESYSRLCTTYSIRRLVRDSLKAAKFEATQDEIETTQRDTITEIAKIFDKPSITRMQAFGLYWQATRKPTDAIINEKIKAATGNEIATFKDDSNKILFDDLNTLIKIKNLFYQIPKYTETFETDITNYKPSLDKAISIALKHKRDNTYQNIIASTGDNVQAAEESKKEILSDEEKKQIQLKLLQGYLTSVALSKPSNTQTGSIRVSVK